MAPTSIAKFLEFLGHSAREAADYCPWPEEREEDNYAAFVRASWANARMTIGPIDFICDGCPAQLLSLTPGGGSRVYLNMIIRSIRVTYAADGRHSFAFDGHAVDSCVFGAILAGLPVDEAMAEDPYPRSPEEALSKDRIRTSLRKYLINYMNGKGESTWRVVSNVRRGGDHMTAQCHYRWGQRRTFAFERLKQVLDPESGELISREIFLGAKSKEHAVRKR